MSQLVDTCSTKSINKTRDLSIPERFEQQVKLYPDNIAVKTDRFALTYEALNKAANQIARAIVAQRGVSQEPILLLFEHDAPVIVALFGALKAGKIYVALDPALPNDRFEYILRDTQAGLILTNTQNMALASSLAQNSSKVINIDKIDPTLSADNIELPISPHAPAAIFYTSGSTGKPKGVVKTHLNRIVMEGANKRIAPNDRQSLLYSCSFGVSSANIFSALLNGARLCPYDVKNLGVTRLAGWLRHEGITRFHPPVAFFRQFLDTLSDEQQFPTVRHISLGSQAIYRRDVERMWRHFPADCTLVHTYALTETGAIAQLVIKKDTKISGNVAPVGYVVKGKEVLILDELGRRLGYDEVGEIAVKGSNFSAGYWRKTDLTGDKFLPDPEGGDKLIYLTGDLGRMRPDGCLEHRGRKDFQVKVRGYRIELAEIEIALHSLDAVKEAVVIAQDHAGDKRLVAYWVPAVKPLPAVSQLHHALAQTLPDYMLPSIFVALDKLPLTANGKINRQALPNPTITRPQIETPFAAPGNPVEEELVKIWAAALGFEEIGINDNFFELGGQSLQGAQVMSEVRHKFEVDIPLGRFFKKPTVAELAAIITQIKNSATQLSDEELQNALRLLGAF